MKHECKDIKGRDVSVVLSCDEDGHWDLTGENDYGFMEGAYLCIDYCPFCGERLKLQPGVFLGELQKHIPSPKLVR